MIPALTMTVSAAERGAWWPASWVGRFWVLFGFGAQAMFTGRFVVQWIASELRHKSYVPVAFWYFSIAGALMLLVYSAFWKHDPVVTLGQATGCFIYVRNLLLIRDERRALERDEAGRAED